MFYGNLTGFGGGGDPGYRIGAVNFDGTNDYLTRSGWAGSVSDKRANWSGVFWAKAAADSTGMCWMGGNAGCPDHRRKPDNKVQAYTWFAGCAGNVNVCFTDTTLVIASGWTCVMISSNGSTNQIYYGDTDVTDSQATSTTSEENTFTTINLMSTATAGSKWNGDIADFWFTLDNRFDWSVTANRRLFIDDAGKPVYLGENGELPYGSSPTAFMHIDDGETPANFAVNAGTGGTFTIVGALTTASTSPSD